MDGKSLEERSTRFDRAHALRFYLLRLPHLCELDLFVFYYVRLSDEYINVMYSVRASFLLTVFSARCNIIYISSLCQCPSVCPSVCKSGRGMEKLVIVAISLI